MRVNGTLTGPSSSCASKLLSNTFSFDFSLHTQIFSTLSHKPVEDGQHLLAWLMWCEARSAGSGGIVAGEATAAIVTLIAEQKRRRTPIGDGVQSRGCSR